MTMTPITPTPKRTPFSRQRRPGNIIGTPARHAAPVAAASATTAAA